MNHREKIDFSPDSFQGFCEKNNISKEEGMKIVFLKLDEYREKLENLESEEEKNVNEYRFHS